MALPSSYKDVSEVKMDTAKVHALLEGLTEFRPYLDDLLSHFVQSFSPFLHGFLDHVLYIVSVDGVENIAKPTLVNVNPVLLIREISEECRIAFSMVQEILLGKTLNDRHS